MAGPNESDSSLISFAFPDNRIPHGRHNIQFDRCRPALPDERGLFDRRTADL